MSAVRRLAASALGLAIIGFARALTGARALWRDGPPPGTVSPTVYFANHRSHGDFVLIWATLPPAVRRRTRPVAGADYWLASPLRGFIARDVFRAVLIDRTAKQRDVDPVESMAAVLDAGDALILFPEGTRNITEDRPLLPLKSGLYHLARRCPKAVIVPVWIDNLGRVLPKGTLVPLPLACTVAYGAPVTLPPLPAPPTPSASASPTQPTEAPSSPSTEPAAQDARAKDAFLASARDALLALRPEHDRGNSP